MLSEMRGNGMDVDGQLNLLQEDYAGSFIRLVG